MTTAQEKQQAFEAAKKFGAMFPGLLETLQEWASIGSMQQTLEATESDINKRIAAAKSEHGQLKIELEAARRQAAERLANERSAAETEMARKKAAHEREVERLSDQQAKSIAMAKDQVEISTKRVQELKAEAGDWQKKVDAAKAAHADLANKIAASRSEHEQIKAVVAEALGRLGR